MRKIVPFTILAAACVASSATLQADISGSSKSRVFFYKDASGKERSAEVVNGYQPKQIIHPFAKIDPKIDSKLRRAASIAEERAHAHSRSRCWHYVKDALMASGAVTSRPKSEFAKEAGRELVLSYGFKKVAVWDPYAAPVGAVLVYGASRSAGHVEIRTKSGFVSDFHSKTPSRRPLIGVYTKT